MQCSATQCIVAQLNAIQRNGLLDLYSSLCLTSLSCRFRDDVRIVHHPFLFFFILLPLPSPFTLSVLFISSVDFRVTPVLSYLSSIPSCPLSFFRTSTHSCLFLSSLISTLFSSSLYFNSFSPFFSPLSSLFSHL
jgi:hypothetical protein